MPKPTRENTETHSRIPVIWKRRIVVGVAFATIVLVTLAATLLYLAAGWTVSRLDPASYVADQSELALTQDAAANLYVVYTALYSLKLVTNAGGGWTTTILDSSNFCCSSSGPAFSYPSVALDSAGHVHVVYASLDESDGQSVRYATNASGTWTTTAIHSAHDEYSPSIALDSRGNVHIAFEWAGRPGVDDRFVYLEYATNAGGTWTNTTLLATGFYYARMASLTVDSHDRLLIAITRSAAAGGAAYLVSSGTGWETHTLGDPAEPGYGGLALTLDSADHPQVLYPVVVPVGSGNTTGRLHYATNVSGAWTVGELPWEVDPTASVSLLLDRADRAHVTFSRRSEGLAYATNVSGNWVATDIPDAFPAGFGTPEASASAIGPGSRVYVLFSQRNPRPPGLFYATNAVDGSNLGDFLIRVAPTLYVEAGIFVLAAILVVAVPRVIRRWEQDKQERDQVARDREEFMKGLR